MDQEDLTTPQVTRSTARLVCGPRTEKPRRSPGAAGGTANRVFRVSRHEQDAQIGGQARCSIRQELAVDESGHDHVRQQKVEGLPGVQNGKPFRAVGGLRDGIAQAS
jgi:hypothetical protein